MQELSLHILDLAFNSLEVGSSEITITIKEQHNIMTIIIQDNGPGLEEDVIKQLTDPFYTTRMTREVGLGLPLFEQTCNQALGFMMVTGTLGQGLTVTAQLRTDAIDFIPLGDMASTYYTILINPYHADIIYHHHYEEKSFTICSKTIKDIVGDIPLTDYEVRGWVIQYINENIKQLKEI